MALYEKLRPKCLDEVVGQERAVRTIKRLHASGELLGDALWFTGSSGQGKSTLAALAADLVAHPLCVETVAASKLSTDLLERWKKMARCRPLDMGGDGRRGYAFIVEEAHMLRGPILHELKAWLEKPCAKNCLWCFTTTIAEQRQRKLFADEEEAGCPFLSRVLKIVLNHGPELELAFALHVRQKTPPDLNGQPLEWYVKLAKDTGCNMREMFSRIEAGEAMP